MLAFCSIPSLAQVERPDLPYEQDALEPYISAEVWLRVLTYFPSGLAGLLLPFLTCLDPSSDGCCTFVEAPHLPVVADSMGMHAQRFSTVLLMESLPSGAEPCPGYDPESLASRLPVISLRCWIA